MYKISLGCNSIYVIIEMDSLPPVSLFRICTNNLTYVVQTIDIFNFFFFFVCKFEWLLLCNFFFIAFTLLDYSLNPQIILLYNKFWNGFDLTLLFICCKSNNQYIFRIKRKISIFFSFVFRIIFIYNLSCLHENLVHLLICIHEI